MDRALPQNVLDQISTTARLYELPPALVIAIVMVESNGSPDAWRAEPAYRYVYDVLQRKPFVLSPGEAEQIRAPLVFPFIAGISSRDTEWLGQKSSWGPMQVMGGVARELGYRGPFPGLCSWDEGIVHGCLHLVWLRDRFFGDGGWEAVAAAYNAGSPRRDQAGRFRNQSYVDMVRREGGFQ